ncbi:hypothetical protein H7I41_12170 [Mycobacterium manitobense]|uniref:Uncharacterized protein n=1 Tax=[Mycobacterium] manitobense TaxID=190147 RepID=A0A9X3BVN0_9MYCO|nr:hypothetical protein [[Mycobacterium] manitobense]MCV7170671.1 hypothetical protein [[Mycobacterium] manitobense]
MVLDDTSARCDRHVLVLLVVDCVDVSLAAAVFVSVEDAASAAAFCASFFAAAAAARLLDLLVEDLTLGVDLGVSADGEPPVAESPVVEPPAEGVPESLVDVEPSPFVFELDEPVLPEAEPDDEDEPESPESVGVAQTGDAATADPTPSATASAPTRPT